MLTQEKVSSNWHNIVGAVKEKFGQVTGDDLTRVQGNFDQLVGMLEKKTGQTRASIESFLGDCCSSAETLYDKAKTKSTAIAQQANEYMQEGVSQIGKKAEEGYDYAKSTVKSRPVEALAVVAGISALAGIAIGISMASRRR